MLNCVEKISVIVPVFNVEEYLERCLITLCHQTYKDLEIILVDDGSTDNSLQICNKFAARDSRIKVLSQTNQGVSTARNLGIEASTGEYIAFVDSDDYIHIEMYERLYELLRMHNADISACFLRGCWDSNYSEPPRNDIEIRSYEKIELIKTVFDQRYEINGTGVVVTNKLFKKHIFNNIRFNTKYKRGEDEQIICYLMHRANKYVITDERLYYYFNRPNSLVHNKNDVEEINMQIDILNMYKDRLQLFKDDEYKDIYNTCLLNLMNLTITAFFLSPEKTFRKSFFKNYKQHFNEFYIKVFYNLSIKDKIRFFTFRIFPPMYNLIVLASKRKVTG